MRIQQVNNFNTRYRKEAVSPIKSIYISKKPSQQNEISFKGWDRFKISQQTADKIIFKGAKVITFILDRFFALKYGRIKKSTQPEVAKVENQIKKIYGITARFGNNEEVANTVSTILAACRKAGQDTFLPKKMVVNSDFFDKEGFYSKEAHILPHNKGMLLISPDYLSIDKSRHHISREIGEFVFAKTHPQKYKEQSTKETIDSVTNDGAGIDLQELSFWMNRMVEGKPAHECQDPPLQLIKDLFSTKIMKTMEQTANPNKATKKLID